MSGLRSWMRLQPLTKYRSSGRLYQNAATDIAEGLQARLADPLWLLARQLAFGEFTGADAASPVFTQVDFETSELTRIRGYGQPDPVILPPGGGPLETMIEAEPEPGDVPRPVAGALAGLHYMRLLKRAFAGAHWTEYRSGLLSRYGLPAQTGGGGPPAAHPDDPLIRVFTGRVPDGQGLYRDLDAALRGSGPPRLPDEPPLGSADPAVVTRVALAWLTWYDATTSRPLGRPLAEHWMWRSDRLEYSVSLAGPGPSAETILGADEYTSGSLDWHQFDILGSARHTPRDGVSLGATADVALQTSPPQTLVSLASAVRFAGMPDMRFWAFEDARVSFGDISAPVESVTTSLIVEFALAYGNDHFLIPLRLPVGTLCRVGRLLVTDTFGDVVLIPHVADVEPDGPFRLFEHSLPPPGEPTDSHRDPLFVLFPTLGQVVNGPAIEEIQYIRDQVADIVWGVEVTTLGADGRPIDRTMQAVSDASDSSGGAQSRLRDSTDPNATPLLVYGARTDIEENWFPFVLPDPLGDPTKSTLLPLAIVPPLDTKGITPKPWGTFLAEQRVGGGVQQEEVTGAGLLATRAWQYARWLDGRQLAWVGRRVRPGRPERASRLRFDYTK